MKTPAQAIKFEVIEHKAVYQNAINELWEHNKVIAGVPLENWLIAQSVQENTINNKSCKDKIFENISKLNDAFKIWSNERTDASTMQLSLASIIVGVENVKKAQSISGNKKHWLEIKSHLKKITGNNGKDAIKYVSNITDFAIIIEDYKQDLA